MTLTAIPEDFGSGGSGLSPGGSSGSPSLRDFLEEHRAAIVALQSGTEGEVVLARFATSANDSLAGLAARDGVTPVAGDIALVKNHATGSSKGLYVAASGSWTRLKDANGGNVIKSGMLIQVSEGTLNANKVFELTTDAPITVGSTSLTFAEVDAASALATTTTPGNMSAADKLFLDNVHAAKAALADTDETITYAQGAWRKLAAATLSAGRSKTLGTAGATAGDQIEITRIDVSANTLAVINGGGGAGTLFTFPVSKIGSAKFQFDGTNWELRSVGYQA